MKTRARLEGGEQPGRRARREPDLKAAAREDQTLDARESFQTELDADGEEQQDDAGLGLGVHQSAVAHEPRRVRAYQHAGQQEADDGDEAEALADVGDERPGPVKGGAAPAARK